MSNIATINEVTHPDVKHARIRLNDGWGVIRVTYTDEGFIQIFSSFGHYAYYWTAMGEGVTLQKFFGERTAGNPDYLANKLWDHRNDKKYFDLDKAKEDIMVHMAEEEGFLEEEIKEVTDKLDEDFNDGMSRDLFIDRWMFDRRLNHLIQDIYEYSFGMDYKGRYKTLLNDIIPTIQKYFRGELDESKA